MQIVGLVFAGSSTPKRPEMTAFVTDVLGLQPVVVDGVEADLFDLADGSSFAVAWAAGMGPSERTLGFLVEDLDQAWAELRAAGVETDAEVSTNDRFRYLHFRAPDGHLYELVEHRP